jgi:hypothetical protein
MSSGSRWKIYAETKITKGWIILFLPSETVCRIIKPGLICTPGFSPNTCRNYMAPGIVELTGIPLGTVEYAGTTGSKNEDIIRT